MDKSFNKIVRFLYGPIISVIYFFMCSYKRNRTRLDEFLRGKKVSSLLQFIAIALLIMWLFIFAFSTEESRNALTQEVKDSFNAIKSKSERY